jgi:phosphatidate cytidylyltransferase
MTATPKPPDSSFQTRLKSALILAPLVLIIVYIGSVPFTLLMAFAAGVGVQEWADMVLGGKKPIGRLAAFFAALGAASAGMFYSPVAALCFLLALCFLIFAVNFSQGGPSVKLLLFGVIYIGFSCAVMIWLRGGHAMQGLYFFSTLLAIVWASDVFAYFTGKTIGGPKLAPKISPKKTWAGFIGSSVGAALASAGLACPKLTHALDVDTLGNMGWLGYAVMGFFLAMAGQAGDLFISMFKRHFNVKDTGNLIPGHGGILDRIDALLLVAILYGIVVQVLV